MIFVIQKNIKYIKLSENVDKASQYRYNFFKKYR